MFLSHETVSIGFFIWNITESRPRVHANKTFQILKSVPVDILQRRSNNLTFRGQNCEYQYLLRNED